MLRPVVLTGQAILILLAAYNAITALWGWRDQQAASQTAHRRLFRVVIPAHNEAGVIGALLEDLSRLEYPTDQVDVFVIADRCTDATASQARQFGATVVERSEGPAGKGAAISWYLESNPLSDDEVLIVLDADNRVPPHILSRLCDEIESGHEVVQCYLDVTDTEGSTVAEASALSYWASNRMVQLARANLGWSADLGGTGMAMTGRSLTEAGGFVDTLTEDQDLGVRFHLAGHRVRWLHDVRVGDEKPSTLSIALRQRARWMAGKRSVRRTYLPSLLEDRSPASLDLALRLVQPGRTFVALVSGIFTVVAITTGSRWFLPWWVWATATGVQVLQPIPFLAKEGVDPARLARYPLLVLIAGLWLPVRLLSRRVSGWYHTPHKGSAKAE